MPNIRINRAVIKNYGSIEDYVFNITPGKHLISGKNGSGKSTIVESIVYAYYKKSEKGTNVSRDGKGNCEVSVDFTVDDKSHYCVSRFYGHKTEKNNVKLSQDGDISPRKSESVNSDIKKLINFNYELFVSSCIVLQGFPVNFVKFTPTIRKTIIEELLGFSIWEDYKKLFVKKYNNQTVEYNSINTRLLELKDKMIALNNRVETTKELKAKSQDEIKQDIVKVKEHAKEVIIKKDTLLTEQKVVGMKSDLESKKVSCINVISKISFNLENLKIIIESKICPTCNRSYPENTLDESKQLYKLFLEKEKRLNLTKNSIIESINSFDELNNKILTLNIEEKNCISQLSSLSEKFQSKNSEEDLDEMIKTLNSIVDDVNNLSAEVSEIKAVKDYLEYYNSLMTPSSVFRTNVLKKYLKQINITIESINPLIMDTVSISLKINDRQTGIEVDIFYNKKLREYKSFSGGEKRRLAIIIILAFQKFKLESSNTSVNLLVFDEIFDGLDFNGVQDVLNSIEYLFPESSCIYIITHDNAIKSAFDSVLHVEKTNDITVIKENNGYK